jgi:alpha-L-rhamnosidase
LEKLSENPVNSLFFINFRNVYAALNLKVNLNQMLNITVAIIILVTIPYYTFAQVEVENLKTNFAINPIGIGTEQPQFSWQLSSGQGNVMQEAFQIMVSDSPWQSQSDSANVWNSGKVKSPASSGIKYEGINLQSRKQYYWKVIVWNNESEFPVTSDIASFETGLLSDTDWQANWLGYPAGWQGRVLYFKKYLPVSQTLEKARIYISGLGYYKLFINHERVGENELDPGFTDYGKRVLYVTYDITQYLGKENSIGIIVGSGWYGIPKIKAQIELYYKNGEKEIIVNDDNRWFVTVGPIIHSGIYDGEYYDARLEDLEWNTPSQRIDYSKWAPAFVTDAPGGRMVSQSLEPIKIVEKINPISITEPRPDVYVVDAGLNLAGWAEITIKGQRGDKITMKFAESLYENGLVNQENLGVARSEDTYILKGDSVENWEPSFTYHGFRYIQLEGYRYRPNLDDILVKRVRSDVKENGKFNCSNDLLNQIYDMVKNTEESNLHSIPTDCPQRGERMGWLNDMTVRVEQAIYNFNMARMYAKWIDDVADTQSEDGRITDTAPFKWGNRPADPVSASYLLLPLKCYEFYGNKLILEDHYKGMKAWVDFLYSQSEDGILKYSHWGDWSPPKAFGRIGYEPKSRYTPDELISTAYLYYSIKLISRISEILNHHEKIEYYGALSEKVKDAFNHHFFDPSTGGYGTNNQACNSLALMFGLTTDENKIEVVHNLVEDVKKHGYHLTTGNQCTKYLLESLSENGFIDVAYQIVAQTTYPSWGNMIQNGATTVWERWEFDTGPGMNSHNHPMLGSVGSWFYKYLLGIRPDNNYPGFERFTIAPAIPYDLEYAEGEYESVKGLIKVAWRQHDNKFVLDVQIPANSIAEVYLPANSIDQVTCKDHNIYKSFKLIKKQKQNGFIILEAGSGNYSFIVAN